ncbi:MAG TPA: 1-deoxy-D-xylulose-5-phosphate reductoisomerase [Dyella sp.]|uniref:1-deoxy-D-xylulose-5-phosphate reductoisomerase n=1 Tax=Dyella sp. TaxID=1869338 RepID=UPI002CBAF919|nr:1-deoxy-D-xylulose-5-phosphate reductoisomerase [Dyella sp.]HTV85918.1 1-deoxy-D-xylulose-5-phosphate reductoisomerase [Dyella sp.]
MTRRIAVVGATGSIGSGALQIIAQHPGRFRASVLAAHRNVEALAVLCTRHRPVLAIIADKTLEAALARRLAAAGVRCEVAGGAEAIAQAVASGACDDVIAASSGIAGIAPALAAARAGKRLLLANTESMVTAGVLLRQALIQGGGQLIPLDGRQHAIFRCLSSCRPVQADGLTLTLVGSGGVFRGCSRAQLMTAGPEHIGPSPPYPGKALDRVNAASLMDLGLGLIQAHHLFAVPADRLRVMLQADGQVRGIVERPGSEAPIQIGQLDPRQSVGAALAWPERIDQAQSPPEPLQATPAAFEKPDVKTFRCPSLALQALRAGGDAGTILNAANEVAVTAFLAGSLPFLSIADLIEQALMELPPQPVVDIQTLSERDRTAREAVRRVLRNAC